MIKEKIPCFKTVVSQLYHATSSSGWARRESSYIDLTLGKYEEEPSLGKNFSEPQGAVPKKVTNRSPDGMEA